MNFIQPYDLTNIYAKSSILDSEIYEILNTKGEIIKKALLEISADGEHVSLKEIDTVFQKLMIVIS